MTARAAPKLFRQAEREGSRDEPVPEELLFQLALTKPAAKRAAWLDRECGDDMLFQPKLL